MEYNITYKWKTAMYYICKKKNWKKYNNADSQKTHLLYNTTSQLFSKLNMEKFLILTFNFQLSYNILHFKTNIQKYNETLVLQWNSY
jgi:hypothetical protein